HLSPNPESTLASAARVSLRPQLRDPGAATARAPDQSAHGPVDGQRLILGEGTRVFIGRFACALAALMLLLASGFAAPPPADLDALLKKEPFDAAHWSDWSARLKEWSNEHYEAAQPAFRAGFEYILKASKTPKGRVLPKTLTSDAIAQMLLAGALV